MDKQQQYLQSLFGLSGCKAVVTGASSGLGAAMAPVLAAAGADVLIVARRKEKLEQIAEANKESTGRLLPCSIDLSSDSGIQEVEEAVSKELGGCDILIANAGIIKFESAEQCQRKTFDEVLNFNVTQQAMLAKALLPFLKVAEAGRIINISSVWGLVGGGGAEGLGLASYTTSKHALIGLTRSQAIELAPHGITVNAIAPGVFPSEMTQVIFSDNQAQEYFKALNPMKRLGKLEELATTVLFLSSPKTTYVNGAIIPVDGGWTSW